ncbi:unnamed protein product, partial [Brachionus calyciflorus]
MSEHKDILRDFDPIVSSSCESISDLDILERYNRFSLFYSKDKGYSFILKAFKNPESDNWETRLRVECQGSNFVEEFFGAGFRKNKALVSVKQSFLANTILEAPKTLKRKRDSSKDRDDTGEIIEDAMLSDLNDKKREPTELCLSPIRPSNDNLSLSESSECEIKRTSLLTSVEYDKMKNIQQPIGNLNPTGTSRISISHIERGNKDQNIYANTHTTPTSSTYINSEDS